MPSVSKTLLVCITVLCCVITSVTTVELLAVTHPRLEEVNKRTETTYNLLRCVNAKLDTLISRSNRNEFKKRRK